MAVSAVVCSRESWTRATADNAAPVGAGGRSESLSPSLLALLLLGLCGGCGGSVERGVQGTRGLLAAGAGKAVQDTRRRFRESEFLVWGSGVHRYGHGLRDTGSRAVHTHTPVRRARSHRSTHASPWRQHSRLLSSWRPSVRHRPLSGGRNHRNWASHEKSVFRSPALPLASERRQEPCLRLRGPRPLVEPVRLRGGPSEPPRGAVEGVDVRGRSQHGHGR